VHYTPASYTSLMVAHHPLASDADATDHELAQAQAECALALGRLDGLLTGLAPDEASLFCMRLLRLTLISALEQAGFIDTEMRFDWWFSGLDRGPEETALTSCSAHAVVRALLDDLGRHSWQPLAEAAQTIARAARFVTDRPESSGDMLARDAIAAGCTFVAQVAAGAESPLPFSGLSHLGDLLRQDPMFAPVESEARVFNVAGRDVLLDQRAPRTPLWAVDAILGALFAAGGFCRPALPFPGAISAESLGGHLWANERGVVEARALAASTARLTRLITTTSAQIGIIRERLGHLRSSSRAPQVWYVLAGFSSLGVDQLEAAASVSRRGTYAVADALVAASVARRETIKGKVLLVAEEPRPRVHMLLSQQSAPLPSPALAEFESAMAEIDRLLVRDSEEI
jgi:hypothetical protein